MTHASTPWRGYQRSYQAQKGLATEAAAAPWTPLLAGCYALLASLEQSTSPGVHASELTYWDALKRGVWWGWPAGMPEEAKRKVMGLKGDDGQEEKKRKRLYW